MGLGILSAALGCKISATNPPEHSEQPVYKDEAFTDFFKRTSGWVAGDGAISIPLSDGRVVWLFGDSHIDDYDPATETVPCLFQVRNCALLQEKKDLQHPRTLIGQGPGFKSLFKNISDGDYWLWPGAGFQGGDAIYIYLNSLKKTGSGGAWGFDRAGNDYLGKTRFPQIEVESYMSLPDFNKINFGCGFVNDPKSGYVYAFGNKQASIESDVYVARFRATNPQSNWNFWDGKAWQADVSKAAVVTRAASTSVSVSKIKAKYLLTTSEFSVGCDQGKEIYVSTSRSPTGPFSARKRIFTIDDTVQGHHPFFYLPMAHPEFTNDKDELLITYSINGYEPCISSCVNGRGIPDHYRPKAIRVPLRLIDPDM